MHTYAIQYLICRTFPSFGTPGRERAKLLVPPLCVLCGGGVGVGEGMGIARLLSGDQPRSTSDECGRCVGRARQEQPVRAAVGVVVHVPPHHHGARQQARHADRAEGDGAEHYTVVIAGRDELCNQIRRTKSWSLAVSRLQGARCRRQVVAARHSPAAASTPQNPTTV